MKFLEHDEMSSKTSLLAIATGISLLIGSAAILPLQAEAQRRNPPIEVDQDNIYHEDDNLPDDADIFPRMGRTAGSEREANNCRAAAWGRVVKTIPGNAFVEINNRSVDRNGESWFRVADLNCWIHDSRIDLL